MPRRIFRAQATYDNPAWDLGGMLTGIGGTLMFIGVMLFFLTVGLTVLMGRRGEQPKDVPVSETLTAPSTTGWERSLDRLGLWFVAAIVLILIAYGPFFLTYDVIPVSAGFKGF